MGYPPPNSPDSRVFGPWPKGNVIGRAWLRYWPFNTFGILSTPSHPELQGAAPSPSVAPSEAQSAAP